MGALCAVLYPLQMQFNEQKSALLQYDKDTKMCQELMVERPDWDVTKNCFERIDERENTLTLYSFRHFWVYDVVFWPLELFSNNCAAVIRVLSAVAQMDLARFQILNGQESGLKITPQSRHMNRISSRGCKVVEQMKELSAIVSQIRTSREGKPQNEADGGGRSAARRIIAPYGSGPPK